MPLRSEFYPHLADPSPESWRAVCRLLDDPRVGDVQRLEDARALLSELRAWPPEIAREPPAGSRRGTSWGTTDGTQEGNATRDAMLALCLRVREVDLYRLYIDAACKDPPADLRLRDGTPAVRLARAFTGAMQGGSGRLHRLGAEGQGDLVGTLCVEWSTWEPQSGHPDTARCQRWHRLCVPVEFEVKLDAGKPRPAQIQRQGALRRRGELYEVVRRTAHMLAVLRVERDRVLALVGAEKTT